MPWYRMMFVACLVAFDSGCHSHAGAQSAGATLQVDSAQYTVRFQRPMYLANIAYTYSNRSGAPVSTNYCKRPPPPALEKQLADGRWVVAYNPVFLACLSIPPFRVESGGTYRDTLNLAVAPRGLHFGPELEVDTIVGTYRLHWSLRRGTDPDNRNAPLVEAISPTFRLILR